MGCNCQHIKHLAGTRKYHPLADGKATLNFISRSSKPMLSGESSPLFANKSGELYIVDIFKDAQPFMIDIQTKAETFASMYCQNLVVFAVGEFGEWKDKILAQTVIKSSILNFNGCAGSGKLIFPSNFNPNSSDAWIRFYLVTGSDPDQRWNTYKDIEEHRSQGITFNKPQKDLKESGVLTERQVQESLGKSWGDSWTKANPLGSLNSITRNVAIVVGIGALIYYTPVIKGFYSQVMNKR